MSEPEQTKERKPSVIITIGMAGSGKTTFVQRINSYLHAVKKPPYILNLDPAVSHLPFEANIDIRDTVDYAQVMKQYEPLLVVESAPLLITIGTSLAQTAVS